MKVSVEMNHFVKFIKRKRASGLRFLSNNTTLVSKCIVKGGFDCNGFNDKGTGK